MTVEEPTPKQVTSPPHIGRYQLKEVVGTGTFATVHRAFDQRLGDTVAVKVLAENHSLDPEARERFIAEGRSLRQVSNPHVIRVHDMGETDRHQPYLVLEYADRGTLAQRVAEPVGAGARARQVTRDDVLVVARSLATAVGALHQTNLVHRDLNPHNILLRSSTQAGPGLGTDRDGRDGRDGEGKLLHTGEQLVLADLGLVKDLSAHSGMTVGGGTEGFRPPEQRRVPGRVDSRADLWALSAVVAWLITGRPP